MDDAHFLTQPPPTSTLPRSRFKKRWIAYGVLAAGTALLLGIAAVVAWSLFPGGEVRALRAALIPADAPPPDTRIEFRVGWPVLATARAVASLVRVDREVADALRAVRRAEVSVHEFGRHALAAGWKPDLDAADRALGHSGWERVVGVREPGEVVGVYVQKEARPGEDLDVCVFVRNRKDLAIVSARCDPAVLLTLVERHGRN